MERFNFNTWLQDKSRKIVTRDGRQARIICYDVKQGKYDGDAHIIALVDKGEEIGEMSYYYSEDGSFLRNPNQTHNLDLFFADEKTDKILDELKSYLKNTPKEQVEKDWKEIQDWYSHNFTNEEHNEKDELTEFETKELEKSNPYSGNQKQKWSEEDDKMLNDILMCGEHHCYLDSENIAWLKSIKNRVHQEWSEEDKSMYIRTLGILGKCYMGELPTKVEEELEWLKSIEPQSHWKPSKEQMEALFEAKLASINNREYFLGLLYEDLKKL